MVRYMSRHKVIVMLFELMEQTLEKREMSIILAYCGYFDEHPYTLVEIADKYDLLGSKHAEKVIGETVQKIRKAVLVSPIMEYVYGFTAD